MWTPEGPASSCVRVEKNRGLPGGSRICLEWPMYVAKSCSCVVYAVHVVGGSPGGLSVSHVVLDSGAACNCGRIALQAFPGLQICTSWSACVVRSCPWRRIITRIV